VIKQTTPTCPHCAELEQRNEWLESQLATWDPIRGIRRALPPAGEAAKLLQRVVSRYPHMKEQNVGEHDQVANFLAGLAFVWSLTQTKEPCVKYSGSWWTSEAAMWCTNARLSGRPRTLLPALIASDVPYMLDHSSLFVDPHRSKGTAVDRAAWRRIVNGGELRPAIPVKAVDDRSIGHAKVQAMW
jgi:hypothetical protein